MPLQKLSMMLFKSVQDELKDHQGLFKDLSTFRDVLKQKPKVKGFFQAVN